MNKLAYRLGQEMAKEAFGLSNLTSMAGGLASKLAPAAKSVGGFLAKNPMARNAAIGAGVGGATGALTAGPGNRTSGFMHGAMPGAAVGALGPSISKDMGRRLSQLSGNAGISF